MSGVCGAWLTIMALALGQAARAEGPSLFERFTLPQSWQTRFWTEPDGHALLKLEPQAVAALVPVQAGLRFCRCPGCFSSEQADTLGWSVQKPDVVTCSACGIAVPNDALPAKVKGSDGKEAVPEDAIEVLPHVWHWYRYHVVPPEHQAYPDERLYLQAKRDYEAREYLSKATLYAAVRYRGQQAGQKDPALARLAAVLLLRFAQVYPGYAVHYDQPGQPKYFQAANQSPPYRQGFRSAKWDSSGSLDVPLNLVIAYALLRGDPAIEAAGKLLDDPHPERTIETRLFRASAEFVRKQPDAFQEDSLYAYRGMLAVGRLLRDDGLVAESIARLNAFSERGFYSDGLWRQGDDRAHRRVMSVLDGWIAQLLASSASAAPMLSLAHRAEGTLLAETALPDIQQATWPPRNTPRPPREPGLLGSSGVARLAVGNASNGLDVELRGLGDRGGAHFNRLAIRLAVAGRPMLGDLDDQPPSVSGWELATAAHNTVVVDGLNQRETVALAREPAAGSDVVFFAADPDFQVVSFEDPQAYPVSATRYRHTLVAAAAGRARYAVSVFEVHGGLQHDQLVQAAPGVPGPWSTSARLLRGPASLLPDSIVYLPTARAEDGRWFLQAYGAFSQLRSARLDQPSQAVLGPADGSAPGLRLHLFIQAPVWLFAGTAPGPGAEARRDDDPGRALLLLRRRSADGSTLKTVFISLYEALGPGIAPLKRAGQVASPPDTVVLYLETAQGPEHLVVNLSPGTEKSVTLLDGRALHTDGFIVRVTAEGLVLAGGSFAHDREHRAKLEPASGTIRAVFRQPSVGALGWFETEAPLANAPSYVGRTLLIQHGNGRSHGWTIRRVEPTPDGRARLFVREEPGFQIDPRDGSAHYYQFPRQKAPGPHHYRVCRFARTEGLGNPQTRATQKTD